MDAALELVPIPLPPSVTQAPECTPLATYILWRLERRIGGQADPPSRDPESPRHGHYRYVRAHGDAFQYDEPSGSFVSSGLRLEQAQSAPDAPEELIAEMEYEAIARFDQAAWEDGDGRAHVPRLLDAYRAFAERHPLSRLARRARERAKELAGSEPGGPGPDVVGEDGLLPGQTPAADLGGLALLLADHDSLGSYRLGHVETESVPGLDARVSRFFYQDGGDDAWPRGNMYVLWRGVLGRRAEGLWTHPVPGDFPPHDLHWVDLDGDGALDLFYTAGMDQVETTRVYLNRIAKPGGSPFVEAFRDDSDYAVLVDLDADARPELLDPGEPDFGTERPLWAYRCGLSPDARRDAQARFGELTDPWTAMARYETLYPLRRVRVLGLRPADGEPSFRLEEVTDRFPDHLRWRLGLLDRVEVSGEECEAMIDGLRTWLRGSQRP